MTLVAEREQAIHLLRAGLTVAERFHRDTNHHVWEATYLDSRTQVQRRGERFFAL